MPEIDVKGHRYSVRSLKRGEIRELREKHDISLSGLTMEKADEAVDMVFDLVFSEEEKILIHDLENPSAMKLWREILKETYGSPGEEKNS